MINSIIEANFAIMQKNRKVRIDALKSRVTKLKYAGLNNHKKFAELCYGYSIASKTLISMVRDNTELASKACEIMKQIQKELHLLQKNYNRYGQHLFDSSWCEQFLKPYSEELKIITGNIDSLLEDSQYEQKH